MTLLPSSTILFQGDSITDAGRDRSDSTLLGGGYVSYAAQPLTSSGHTVYNRGISGNRVHDLVGRWQEDAISLKPQIISILIGINNVWRRYDSDDPTSLEMFVEDYTTLLTRTRDQLGSDLILMLGEPFLLHVNPERASWREDLDPKISAVHQLAKDFNAVIIPFDQDFKAACQEHPPAHWAGDGVHPSQAGHQRMAALWLKTLEKANS